MSERLEAFEKLLENLKGWINEKGSAEIGEMDIEEIEWLIAQNKHFHDAHEHIKYAIYTQHCTINNMENTGYEKGQINGLLTASNIVDKALERVNFYENNSTRRDQQ